MIKRPKDGKFFILIEQTGKTKHYSYVMDVLVSQDETRSVFCSSEFEGLQKSEMINITQSAYYLALIRSFPQEEHDVQEIMNYANGVPVTLSLTEKFMLWCKRCKHG